MDDTFKLNIHLEEVLRSIILEWKYEFEPKIVM